MSIQTPAYATREQVKRALDYAETARSDARVDRAVESGSRAVESICHRVFYPQTGTRYFNWPDVNWSRPWRLWLDADELVSVTTVTAGGTVIAASDYFLEPVNSGPPYTHVEIDLASSAELDSGDTHQRAVQIDGVFAGAPDDEASETTLAEALDDSETEVDVATASEVGVGSLVKIDDERMLVTDVADVDTAVDTSGALSASVSDVTVSVADGSTFSVGESLLIDSERVLVVAVAGNALTVKRAWDGSVLAAHSSGASVFAPRRLSVRRGAAGTTAAAHDDASAVTRWLPPSTVRDYVVAHAVDQLLQEQSGYARVAGSGDNAREATGRGLQAAMKNVWRSHGRKMRTRAV